MFSMIYRLDFQVELHGYAILTRRKYPRWAMTIKNLNFKTLLLGIAISSLYPLFFIFCNRDSALNVVSPEVYEEAQKDWETQFAPLAQYGWGPTVQAEKWNGRHAMFGWFFICATAYAKGHGLIPGGDDLLDLKEWGTLATISGKGTISNERAIILIANAHAFSVGLLATICPPPFGDSLLLDPNHPESERMTERNAQGFGYLPALKFGLTAEAEIINGRLAMVGLISLVMASAIFDESMIDIVNDWVGGAYF
jgi:hypothetical protein